MTVGHDLERRIVMRRAPLDDRIRQPPGLIVNVDYTFAHDFTVRESDEPRIPVELRIHDKFLRKACVNCTNVSNRCPHLLGWCVDLDLFTNGSHRSSFRLFPEARD